MAKTSYDTLLHCVQTITGIPAANLILKVEEHANQFHHHYVVTLLYMPSWARSDIHTAVEFLCTRIVRSDEDHWNKLKSVMGYLSKPLFLSLILG